MSILATALLDAAPGTGEGATVESAAGIRAGDRTRRAPGMAKTAMTQ
ncbi:hypothetical protein [Methylobacterium oxalidis]|uniref:Uncharacterized protein n=1 Tax=Methylobacterium oxalidis TaxID=944322 RepID=A0A512IZN8_9HYPH|nr:hypothetical protein [Methylobacterium oxalidis]GEP03172.1 hypothetical protein MOX02_12100 [Methylobacterium oxalidis]GJE31449.1 hypothetical protein LDDCCGHA_1628 [Methylobacterium oxalidis]GLS67431.1 hypothetical protein GCM10007888_58150 [Methylobacterium oxalidis]